jgi:hypothetical protein
VDQCQQLGWGIEKTSMLPMNEILRLKMPLQATTRRLKNKNQFERRFSIGPGFNHLSRLGRRALGIGLAPCHAFPSSSRVQWHIIPVKKSDPEIERLPDRRIRATP